MSTEHKYNASDLFVQALEAEGVEYIYGIPGEENLDLLEALRKSKKIKIILTRHEQAAGFMAATYGRMTGKVGVAISTLGPGATNFTTSAAYATLGGFPVLFITGQKPIKKNKQGKFQVIDVVAMMKPLTKYSKVIVDVNMVTATIREAFRVAVEGKMGAVHIEFPEDISAEEVQEDTQGLFAISHAPKAYPSLDAVKKVADLVKKAKLPIVLVGSACNLGDIPKAMQDFVNTTKMPFITSQMGKGVVAEDHEQYIGTTSLSSTDYVHDLTAKADLIINVGYDVIEKPPYFPKKDQTIIHVSHTSASLDNVYAPSFEVLGDIAQCLSSLASEVGACKHDFSYAYKVKTVLNEQINADKAHPSFPVKPQNFVEDLQNYMSKDGFLSLDNGMYKLWFARNYKCMRPNTLLLDNALATMGAGFPSAMEIARLYPDKKVLAVCGDGGFMMNSQEIETAIRLGLNVVCLILNDSAYGMIRWKQNGMGFDDYAMTFNNPDFVKYAQSYGAKGYRITKADELISVLDNCFKEKGVHIIDMPIDYSENKKFFTQYLIKREKVQ